MWTIKFPPSNFKQIPRILFLFFLSRWSFVNQKSTLCADLTQLCFLFYLYISLSLNSCIENHIGVFRFIYYTKVTALLLKILLRVSDVLLRKEQSQKGTLCVRGTCLHFVEWRHMYKPTCFYLEVKSSCSDYLGLSACWLVLFRWDGWPAPAAQPSKALKAALLGWIVPKSLFESSDPRNERNSCCLLNNFFF